MGYDLNFAEVTYALSEALDLVGVDDVFHGKRVAYMAAECLKHERAPQAAVDDAIHLGMLHDCGVSTTETHARLVSELDWDGSQAHAERGHRLLSKVQAFRRYAPAVRYHHAHWEHLAHAELDGDTRRDANLLFLVDRVDALRTQYPNGDPQGAAAILNTLRANRGGMFAPALVDLFAATAARPSFWFYLEDEALETYFRDWLEAGRVERVAFGTLKEVALMFADVVDAKSPFTHRHSLGVAALAVFLARRLRLTPAQIQTIELAALLHDLGKLRVTDAILDKRGPLDSTERRVVSHHAFVSGLILSKIKGFREIGHLAALHHETLDGRGYPYRLEGAQLPVEARIVAVADIFQALVQERPYRRALEASSALAEIERLAAAGKLDGDIAGVLRANLEEAFRQARGGE